MNMDTHANLYQAILDNPTEIIHRLAFADFLLEEGDEDDQKRGEWIHHAINRPASSHVELTRMSNDADLPESRRPFNLLGLDSVDILKYGNGSEYSPLNVRWMWGEWDSLGVVFNDVGRGLHYKVDNGFISAVGGTQENFIKHAQELFSLHPIERVILTDRKPYQNSNGLGWYKRKYGGDPDDIHTEIWNCLTAHIYEYEDTTLHSFRWYNTEELAINALERACVKFGIKLRKGELKAESL